MPSKTRSDFLSWIEKNLTKNSWTPGQLAQRAGISYSSLAKVMRGTQPEALVCIGLARALKLPADYVLRKAGLLPPVANDDVPMEIWLSILSQLPDMDRLDLLRIARQKPRMTQQPQQAS